MSPTESTACTFFQFLASTVFVHEWEQHSPVTQELKYYHNNASSPQLFRFLEILYFCVWKTVGLNMLIEYFQDI